MLDTVALLPEVVALADRAGAIILKHYEHGAQVRTKADASPVTAADEAAEAAIVAGLARLTPEIPIVAEELVAKGQVPALDEGPFWLVDPLDGTREFLQRNGEFTVNIALIEGVAPVLGVVLAPALGQAWWGALGLGASTRRDGQAQAIHARARPAAGAIAVASRSHRDPATDAWLAQERITECISAGSALKFCLVAEGRADVYPRFGPTMEWDTAAGQAVLQAAGGRVTTPEGAPFVYRKPGFRNGGFIGRGVVP
jgi:3'(2'), 5'-bisphosphate nucleotidase